MSNRASIPHLLRVHFANIGHPDARLSPLTLDFQGIKDMSGVEPLDSVIWAENGVGKSSIRALLFSLLHPNIHDVMKSSNAPLDNRKFELFFGDKDSAFVVTEWALPSRDQRPLTGFAEDPHSLIIGFTAFWPAGHQSSLGDLERHYFMFEPRGALTFDRLPIRGLALGTEPLEHSKAFLEWFRTHARTIEGRSTTIHKEWSSWLAEVGLDPVIFAYQLRMNGSQGGILGLFKNRINSSTDFVHFFLETVLNDDAAGDVVDVLNEKKAHLQKKVEWEAEISFVNEALPLLEGLQRRKKDYRQAERAFARDRQKAGGMISGLVLTERELKARGEELRGELKDCERDISAKQETYLLFQEYRSWLRYHESVLGYELAETRLEGAHEAHGSARTDLRLLKAALEHLHWQAKLDECRAIEKELAERQNTNVDVEISLRNAGTVLARVLDREIKKAETELADGRNDLALSRKNLVTNQKRYNRVKSDLGKVNEALRGIDAQMQNREKVLRRLVHSLVLEEGESPRAAVTRWKNELRGAEETAVGVQEKLFGLEEVRGGLRNNQHERLIKITKLQSEMERMEIARAADRYTMEELESDRNLRLLMGEEQVTLANPDLSTTIRERLARDQREVFELSRLLADERETLANIEASESRLYPPPAEVSKLLRLLRDDLAISAFPATEELDRRFPDDPERAEQLFMADPARFMGIMVPDKKALDRVAKVSGRIHKPAFPIQVSLSGGKVSEPAADALVLRPGHFAAFNRKAAAGLIEPLRSSIASHEARIDELHHTAKRLNATLDKLQKFLAVHSGGNLAEINEKIEDKRTVIGVLEIEQSTDQEKQRALDGEMIEASESVKAANQLKQRCEASLARLRDFIEDHESQYSKLQDDLASTRQQLHTLEDKSLRLEAALEEDHHLVAEQQELIFARKNNLDQKQEKARAVHYQGGELGDVGKLTLTEVEASYNLFLDRFRKVSEKDETLRARLEEKRIMAGEREARFRRELGPHDEKAVAEILAQGPLDDRLVTSENGEREAFKAVGAAEAALANARESLREAPTVRVDYEPPPEESLPEDAEAVKAKRAEIGELLERWRGAIDEGKERLSHLREDCRLLREDITLRTLKREELVTHVPDYQEAEDVSLPRDNQELKRLLDDFWELFHEHRRKYHQSKRDLDDSFEKLKDLASDTRFQDFSNDKRELLKIRESVMRLTDDIVNEFHIFREVILTSLRLSEESVEAILTRLDAHVSDALYLLNLARSSSRLPESMEDWGNLSFLKMEIAGKVIELLEERKPVYERVLREALESGKPIRGIDLIKRGVDALAGVKGYRVSIMKPGYALKTEYHPITDVKGWSDGEKITTVILLYCTMVQLRAVSGGGKEARTGEGTLSNGMLFLDNPFGEANSLTFVKMQLSMARALNIQLVYTASGSHKHLMARFPRVIRLSQESAEASQKTFVKATDVGKEVRASINVTAAHFGKRRVS